MVSSLQIIKKTRQLKHFGLVKMCIDIRVVTCGPNEALIISGVCYSPPTIIVGGRAFVCPCIHKVQKIALSTMTLIIESRRVYTAHGVPVSVTGVAQVTVTSLEASYRS